MHQREFSKELNTSLTRVQKILKELRDINAIDFKVAGKNHVYFLKRNLISKSLILNAENYKLLKLLRKHQYLEPIFMQIIKKCLKEMVILFGSYAKGTENRNSDIDIYISTTNQKLKEEIQDLYEPLSVKIGRFNQNDLLIKEIIKNHIIIRGSKKYYESIKFFDSSVS